MGLEKKPVSRKEREVLRAELELEPGVLELDPGVVFEGVVPVPFGILESILRLTPRFFSFGRGVFRATP